MNTSHIIKHSKLLLGIGATVCALLNSTCLGVTLGILDTAVNPANDHIYYLLDNSNWTDAENAAVELGGTLATINDLEENNWIWNLWGDNHNLWIGLYDPTIGDGSGTQHAADFMWASGDSSNFRNWRPGEPNNADFGEYNVYIFAKSLVPEGGVWNDIADITQTGGQPDFYGVVEVVPEPASGVLLAGGMFTVLFAKRIRR